MNFSNFLGFNKKKRIRALRMEEQQKKKNLPKFSNPYFPQKEKLEIFDKNKKKKNMVLIDILAIIGIIVLLVGASLYLIFGTNYFIIKNINISGNKNISQDEINSLIDDYTNTNRCYFISTKNWLFFQPIKAQNSIKEGISNKFALADVKIYKKWPNTINITITERIPGLVWVSKDQYYYLDLEGFTTEKITSKQDVKQDFPIIYDKNEIEIVENKQVIAKKLVDFILSLSEELTKAGFKIDSYSIPKITCEEQQYKMEKIITEEIDKTSDKELKEKKKKILDRYNKGEITAEESILLLDNLKNANVNENNNTNSSETMEWQAVTVPKECDYAKIIKEIDVKTTDNYEIYFDSSLDLNTQIKNLQQTISQKIKDIKKIKYIDVRYLDRVYYK